MNRLIMHESNRLRGFSLVELMIALLLGLLLTAGMIQLFSSSKVTFTTNDALARVQENGRFALETLKRELRESGTLGFCAGDVEITNHLNTSCGGGAQAFFNPNLALVGWEYANTGPGGTAFTLPEDLDPAGANVGDWNSSVTGTPDLPGTLSGLVAPWSDVLVVRRMQPVPGLTAAEPPPLNQVNSASINLTRAHGLPDDALVLVTNCSNADLFQNRTSASAAAFSAGGGSCANPGPGNQPISAVNWSTSYAGDLQAFTMTQVAYYVGTRVDAVTGETRPGLYRLDLSNGTINQQQQELVEGVESMQILYGFSRAAPAGNGQSVNDWLRADQVPANGWQQVIALRIALSVRSPENADTDNSVITYDLAGSDMDAPGDGRIRQPFSATIALRNRVLVDTTR